MKRKKLCKKCKKWIVYKNGICWLCWLKENQNKNEQKFKK